MIFAESCNIPTHTFDLLRGESDSLAGLILEIAGEFPNVNQQFETNNYIFTVLEINKNRIAKVKLTLKQKTGKINHLILEQNCRMLRIFYFIFVCLLCLSCNSNYTSKKEGYFKIDFPKKQYTTFNEPGYPYTFEYPVYARIAKDSSYFAEGAKNPYWINIEFPTFNGTIFISYKKIGGTSVYKIKNSDGTYRDSVGVNSFEKMVNDAYNLTYKNDVKAYSIEDSLMHTSEQYHRRFF